MAQLRDGFQSRLGFVLAAAGAAVGLGNCSGNDPRNNLYSESGDLFEQ